MAAVNGFYGLDGLPRPAEFPENLELPLVYYTLQGAYKVDSPVFMRDLMDINRRLAIIIGNSLFHTAKPFWKTFNSSVASDLFRQMTSVLHATNVRFQAGNAIIRDYATRFDLKRYIIDEEKRIRWSRLGEDLRHDAISSGCLEMAVFNKFLVQASYVFEIHCKMVAQDQDLNGFLNVPEPNNFWSRCMEEIDKVHKDTRKQAFSSSLADFVIFQNDDIYRRVNQAQFRISFPRHIFTFNS